jgi:hypothetical protein
MGARARRLASLHRASRRIQITIRCGEIFIQPQKRRAALAALRRALS